MIIISNIEFYINPRKMTKMSIKIRMTWFLKDSKNTK